MMINVTIEQEKITASGHAGYAPKGQDIVCAAFSVLSLTLERAVDTLTDDEMEINLESGKMKAQFFQHL